MKKPKLFYICTMLCCLMIGVAATVLVSPPRIFRQVSQDGVAASNLGASGKGTGMATSSWLSSDGARVDEFVIGYSSVEDARSDFDLEQSQAEQVIEHSPESSRLIAKFGPSYRSSFKVIKLKQNQISYIQSRQLEAALEFEKSWLKLPW